MLSTLSRLDLNLLEQNLARYRRAVHKLLSLYPDLTVTPSAYPELLPRMFASRQFTSEASGVSLGGGMTQHAASVPFAWGRRMEDGSVTFDSYQLTVNA